MSDFNIATTNDDVSVLWQNGYTEFNQAGDLKCGRLYVLNPSDTIMEFSLRFTNVTIPQGAEITNASFNIKTHIGGTLDFDIQAFDEDNSSQVASFSDFQSRSRTTVSVGWTGSLNSETVYDSPSIISVIQEIVNRASWSSGNALQLVLSDHLNKYPNTGSRGDAVVYFYENSTYSITLSVTYVAYTDIGLRIRTSTATIKIGVQTLDATHKLRIRKGDTTYGIPLLALDDPSASGLRIYDGANVKALPKVS